MSPDSPHNALMQPPSPSALLGLQRVWAEGGGRQDPDTEQARVGPRSTGLRPVGGRKARRQTGGVWDTEPPSGAGVVPFITSWAVRETWLPGAADRVARDRQVWPRESAHG